MCKIKIKYINIEFSIKSKYSGFNILPMLVFNWSYKALTFALFIFVIELQYNYNKSVCPYCGAICENIIEAGGHCLDELF